MSKLYKRYIFCPVFFALSTTEEASHSWGETFGGQKCHRLVCGKLMEDDVCVYIYCPADFSRFNIFTFQLVDSVRTVLWGNFNLLLAVVTAASSILLTSGTALLNFSINMVSTACLEVEMHYDKFLSSLMLFTNPLVCLCACVRTCVCARVCVCLCLCLCMMATDYPL